MSLYSTLTAPASAAQLFEQHKGILNQAIKALNERVFFAQYPENAKAYGETAPVEGKAKFDEQLGKPFDRLRQPADGHTSGNEESPYTRQALGVSYPQLNVDHAVALSQAAFATWRKTTADVRAALLIESLERIKHDFYEIAYSTQHTTGQAFMMSFQASGPHASDRALEAIALGYQELTRYPSEVVWNKPLGKVNAVIRKYFKTVPKGIDVTIGCSTFPIWNSVPGIYASLITGNSVIVKPHPRSIYPIAIVVARIQEVLADYGYDPNTVLLTPDTEAAPITKALCDHPAVKLIDFTGGPSFGNYVESLTGKITFTEKAGVNNILIHSVNDMKAVAGNLAFSVSLYSGQMCTAPQNVFVPKGGITAGGEHLSYDQVVEALTSAIKDLVTNEKAGPAIGGAIGTEAVIQRIEKAKSFGLKVLLDSHKIANAEFPDARTAGPLVLEVPADRADVYSTEFFGPIVFVIPTDGIEHSLQLAQNLAFSHGALSCGAYSTDAAVMANIADTMGDAAVPVCFNLAGQVFVNQNAGFSDFHGTGGNPAGNCAFTDPQFITKRFNYVEAKVDG